MGGGRGKMVEREGDKGEESEREGKGRVHRITANAREAKIHIHYRRTGFNCENQIIANCEFF